MFKLNDLSRSLNTASIVAGLQLYV